jgi:hypothetical protein
MRGANAWILSPQHQKLGDLLSGKKSPSVRIHRTLSAKSESTRLRGSTKSRRAGRLLRDPTNSPQLPRSFRRRLGSRCTLMSQRASSNRLGTSEAGKCWNTGSLSSSATFRA